MLSLILAAALAAQAPTKTDAADDYAGRWNVKITDADDTFVSAGFQIDNQGGVLSAGLVWKWGSFAPVKSVEVKDGVLRMVRVEEKDKQDVFEGRLQGGLPEGDGDAFGRQGPPLRGRRAPLLMNKKAPVWGAPVSLFDGKSLAGWKLRDPKAKNGWAVANGELVVVEPKGNADLVSATTFQDAKLHVEFNVEPKSNSGVYVRGKYEVQILDNPDRRWPSTRTAAAPSTAACAEVGRDEAGRRVADARHHDDRAADPGRAERHRGRERNRRGRDGRRDQPVRGTSPGR